MLTYDLTARGRKTMYEYLYEAMKADILSGRLTAGEKLPSKRAFAEHLQVSVKTVENTYEQLLLGESDYFETLMRDEPESYLELALAYLHNGFPETAVELLERIDARTAYPTVKMWLGYLAGKAGDKAAEKEKKKTDSAMSVPDSGCDMIKVCPTRQLLIRPFCVSCRSR